MKSAQLRKKFLDYFAKNGHTVVPSSPVIPHKDPTLLFINAGMNKFKKVFLGQSELEYKRATSSQKCIRVGGKHNDLDNVGHTNRHLTFFEMLGNFSFGDYFKEEAIKFAWDLSIHVLEIDPERVWVSVYKEDQETFELWKKWIPEERIVFMGAEDNYWSMGDTGPCGPCTELYYDLGSEKGDFASPAEDPEGKRFFEFWNLVFMQFNKDENGKKTPLPKPCVDTGMGLERIVAMKNGVDSIFETDILQALIAKIGTFTNIKYEENKPAFHVIADHMRALSFAIADGAQPGNVDRGYVLRKILRRAVRYARQIEIDQPFLADLFPVLLKTMGADFPELKSSEGKICELLTIEEENFFRTLRRGGNILQSVIEHSKGQITGEDAFKLKDTYGFPLEEIMLLAKDSGLSVNLDAFMLLEEKAKELSKASHKQTAQIAEESLFSKFAEKNKPAKFTGYEEFESNGSVIGIVREGEFVDLLTEGQEAAIICDSTPFYAEMGGQVGDKGRLFHHEAEFEVTDTVSPYLGVVLHKGKLKKGKLIQGEPVHLAIDKEYRGFIQNNHTATHLLHWALEKVLGGHIRQTGSLVDSKKLRFDFSHHKPLTEKEIREIETLINDAIRKDSEVSSYELTYEAAKKRSDIKQFFGDKYGAKVRVVDIEDSSKELCGGTHIKHLGKIHLFRIVKESSIAQGIRRIEAATGKMAEAFTYEREDVLKRLAGTLDAPLPKVEERLKGLLEEQEKLSKQLKAMRKVHLKALLDDLLTKKEKLGNIFFVRSKVDLFKDEFAPLANDLLAQLGSGVLLLGMEQDDRCQLLVRVSPDLIERGIKANDLVREIAPIVGGKGGGRPDNAQAGGKNPEQLEAAFAKAKTLLEKHI